MASNANRASTALLAVGALLLSSGLLFFGTGLRPEWWLTWVASLPILLVVPRVSAKAAFGIATVAWFAGGLNMVRYFVSVLGPPQSSPPSGARLLSFLIAALIILVPSCVFGLSVLGWRACVRRGRPWSAVFVFPSVWVAYEYISAVSSPHSTFGNLAYTQMNSLPLLQLASLTGVWGISFCLFLLPGAIATVLVGASSWAQKRAIATAVGILFVAIGGFGWWRLGATPPARSVVVGLAASDLPGNVIPGEPDRLLRDYLEQVKILAARGAEVVVLPEKIAVVLDPAMAETDSLFETVARQSKTRIVVGLIRRTSTAKLNEARLYFGTDLAPLLYDKHHMLPAFEASFQPGTKRASWEMQSGVWGLAICKDMDFPKLSRQYSSDGVGLLLVPAWDFVDDGWLHDRMAVMRGVESGFSIARAAKQGLLTVSDDRGRILAERNTGSGPFVTLVAAVPVRHDRTLYARCGDWFAWASLALLLVILLGPVFAGSHRSAVVGESKPRAA
ncbi:MAG TPA: nitrilase-related carbon-nitrogen hydrolase [Terriglobales bacterium]|nr:nitrilase-related carbon-nitrogen hydrolase [Terriglobales bacterium]